MNNEPTPRGWDTVPGGHEPRTLSYIAVEIRRDWRKPYFGAVPYIEAMAALDTIEDMYGADSGQSVVSYFLANAAQWRGDVARRVKAELNAMLKAHSKARR